MWCHLSKNYLFFNLHVVNDYSCHSGAVENSYHFFFKYSNYCLQREWMITHINHLKECTLNTLLYGDLLQQSKLCQQLCPFLLLFLLNRALNHSLIKSCPTGRNRMLWGSCIIAHSHSPYTPRLKRALSVDCNKKFL